MSNFLKKIVKDCDEIDDIDETDKSDSYFKVIRQEYAVNQEVGMTKKQKEFYSSREAAQLLGVAVSTIQHWTNNGLLEAWTTQGGHRRIARSVVDEMLRQQQSIKTPDQSLSVVVVEDNEQQLRLYEKQFNLSHLNASVVTASDGYSGLIKIGAVLPDVIITDLVMPNMDGFQMLRAVKAADELKDSLIIVVTGLTMDEVSNQGDLPAGVHLLTKPVVFSELETLIRKNVLTQAA